MRMLLPNYYAGPLFALGALVAVTCLAGSWYINRLQADLARAVRQDAAGMEAAVELQVQLRHLRVHSLVLMADTTGDRREVVRGDLARVDKALQAILQTASTPDDVQQAKKITLEYGRYKEDLGLDRLQPTTGTMLDVAKWSDAHHMSDLINSCRALADLQRERMRDSVDRNESQSLWAGRVLFCLGIAGVFGGLLSGYVTARILTQRVAQLSVRVQAVHAHLDQEVGAMTVQVPADLGELDQQLERITNRVSAVCQRLQEQERTLLRAEQLAALGQLAAGVAHEVRNPLTGVKLLLQAAVQSKDPTPLTIERLQLLLQEVGRIERTVQGLVDLGLRPPVTRAAQDLVGVIRAAIDVAQSRADAKSVSIGFQTQSKSIITTIDRDRILSLLTNLLFNAIDASPPNSCIEITAFVDVQGIINVSVSDRGEGIHASIADKLFTPFATTKQSGSGLGLTIAKRVAEEHGGTLAATSAPEGGACFTLRIPTAGI
jgi:two-component system, NtrC family, sensor histidine kinase HydH